MDWHVIHISKAGTSCWSQLKGFWQGSACFKRGRSGSDGTTTHKARLKGLMCNNVKVKICWMDDWFLACGMVFHHWGKTHAGIISSKNPLFDISSQAGVGLFLVWLSYKTLDSAGFELSTQAADSFRTPLSVLLAHDAFVRAWPPACTKSN